MSNAWGFPLQRQAMVSSSSSFDPASRPKANSFPNSSGNVFDHVAVLVVLDGVNSLKMGVVSLHGYGGVEGALQGLEPVVEHVHESSDEQSAHLHLHGLFDDLLTEDFHKR
ncbi:hypothetical protein SUGI_0103080 [Cryptomeria japonica]|nr:hypothetical protein SUGI_0103080 [Cryptomeria japonica]